jgi:hypothetical protein
METKQAVHIMVRAYAGILLALGCLFIVLTIIALGLAYVGFSWGFWVAYQFGLWGASQVISGLFLFLINRRLISFILAKGAEE